jgi:Transposase DDE domain
MICWRRKSASRKPSTWNCAISSACKDLVFYDITSTYFEGAGPAELGRFGYSRDGKPRNRQIVLGVVMMDGWPIAHHVFAGNRLDQTTVLEVVQDLNQRFALNRVVFVGDRGMMTMGNVEQLRHSKQGYLLGLQRRHRKDTSDYIQQAEASPDWQPCPVGITAAEKAIVPQTRVAEVAGKQAGVRVLVVHSEEREVYECSMRELSMERARKEPGSWAARFSVRQGSEHAVGLAAGVLAGCARRGAGLDPWLPHAPRTVRDESDDVRRVLILGIELDGFDVLPARMCQTARMDHLRPADAIVVG